MKRAIIAIILYLLLGLLTSVAVAWGVVLADLEFYRDGKVVTGENGWDAYVISSPGRVEIVACGVIKNREWGPQIIPYYSSAENHLPWWSVMRHRTQGEEVMLREEAAGLPMPCLRFVGEVERWQQVLDWDTDYHGAIYGLPLWRDATKDPSANMALPLMPIVPGLIVNTLTFTSVWLLIPLLRWAWATVRHSERRYQRKCPQCGYDLRAHRDRACPECGTSPDWKPRGISRRVLLVAAWSNVIIGGFIALTASWFALVGPKPSLHYAAYVGDSGKVRRLLSAGHDVDAWLEVPGSAQGLAELREDLVGAFPPVQAITPLIEASMAGDAETVRILLEAGADIQATDSIGRTPLHFAASNSNLATIEELVNSGADLNAAVSRLTPLGFAAMHRDVEVLELLESLGAAIAEDEEAFAMAARHGPAEACEVFFRNGAGITATVLLRAARSGDTEWLDMFVQHGADLLERRKNGETLLFWLPYPSESRPIWERLIEAGIDVNATDDQGRTALFAAGTVEHLRFLLDHGADPTIRNVNGETAADCAWTDEARELLQRAMEEWEKPGS